MLLGFFVASTTEIFTSPSLFKSIKTVVVGSSTNGVYVNFANKNAMSSFFVPLILKSPKKYVRFVKSGKIFRLSIVVNPK